MAAVFENLLLTAKQYYRATGKHLQVFGELGELYGAITYGIKLHRTHAKGSDGRLGNDFVEIKTISPNKAKLFVTVRTDRHFSKLLVVRFDEEFRATARMISASDLPKSTALNRRVAWSSLPTET